MTELAVLVSGGVDSSVALHLLASQWRGRLRAYYLEIWLEDEMASLGRCPWQEDLSYVREVCAMAGVPLEVVSLQEEYHERVVASVLEELRAGRTPSPDLLCNRRVKFGAFREALGPGVEKVASGHHARVVRRQGHVHLHKGADPVKDQSYFLGLLDQSQLERCVFPIGDLTKAEVRALALDLGLPNASRPDSQGICFLGRVPFADFVSAHLGSRPGEIRERSSGRALGRHRGAWFYTIGQRRGLGLAGGPWYVVAKDLEEDVVWVCHQRDLTRFSRARFLVPEPSWVVRPPTGGRLDVRLRHGPATSACRLTVSPEGGLDVRLERPDPGVAPGQFAIFYDGDECLGGGAISL